MSSLVANTGRNYISYKRSYSGFLANSPLRNNRIGVKIIQLLVTLVHLASTNWLQIIKLDARIRSKGYKRTFTDALRSCFKYGISPQQYYLFRFYKQDATERTEWVGANISFYLQNNKQFFHPPSKAFFDDKFLFYETFKEYCGREVIKLATADDLNEAISWTVKMESCIIKPRFGYKGYGIDIINDGKDRDAIRKKLAQKLELGEFVLEEIIVQHPDTALFNPSSVNTIRINAICIDGKTEILGSMFRMGRGDIFVDNMFSGGIAAPVDDDGILCGPAVTIDPVEDIEFEFHPISQVKITGYQLPFWQETVAMIKEAAPIIEGIKSVGWDVAITPTGPVLLEGNVPWGIFGLQLPYQRGRLDKILPYIPKNQLLAVHRKYVNKELN